MLLKETPLFDCGLSQFSLLFNMLREIARKDRDEIFNMSTGNRTNFMCVKEPTTITLFYWQIFD